MGMTVHLIEEGIKIWGYQSRLRFGSIVSQFFAKLRPEFEFPHPGARAIEILRDRSSSPDMRDWAERHLCGMTNGDPSAYFERRRWQS